MRKKHLHPQCTMSSKDQSVDPLQYRRATKERRKKERGLTTRERDELVPCSPERPKWRPVLRTTPHF
ncbi:hypothetical protein DPEC_G00156440 [Dallia pectoralis]|uniref:Uncharacterized protein n=1 Tax=Dallia pectoralis TaxID=75939 RepID=A0ACC2GKQ8_DALPE|nr:hypothetical protein DPEC_G00156440 [Dallia pectoralis]